MTAIDYQKELNSAQYHAVTHTEGPVLVIAGAGSGKTRTLTFRVAYLVQSGVAPESILLLTFTRKSAQEMLQRAAALLDERCGRVAGGTFHSFANNILRPYADRIGFTNGFTIFDRADAEDLVALLRKDMASSDQRRKLPTKRTLTNILSKAVNKSTSIDQIIWDDYPQLGDLVDPISQLAAHYTQRKRILDAMDYDDLLVFLKQLLSEHVEICRHLSKKYRYIMVDEYQDTNQMQAEIVQLLAGDHGNIMVVGDDAQSIYSFRGANFRNIMDFPKMFPGTEVIRLEENYRSIQPILNLTNQVIDQATEKYTKKLFTRREGGVSPQLVSTGSENDQSRFIVEKILDSLDQGVAPQQIAVLFRAGFHSFDLEIELNREGIEFVKYGGFRFMEAAHIKDVLAHLRIVANPMDRISWNRVLLLVEKVGLKSADKIFKAVIEEKTGCQGLLQAKLNDSLDRRLEGLKQLLDQLTGPVQTVSQMGEEILEYYRPIAEARFDDHPRRIKDIEHLVSIMNRYRSLADFLVDMALEPPNASADDAMATGDESERICLSTIHSAKGLEWDTVFVIWVLDGRFPSVHALNDEAAIQEELRLLYVAATRARENLFLTYPGRFYDRSAGLYLDRPSRFLTVIPEDVLPTQSFSTGW